VWVVVASEFEFFRIAKRGYCGYHAAAYISSPGANDRTMTRRVVAIVDDMFFASKVRATAEALGVEIAFQRTKESALEKIIQIRPHLIVVDLQNQRFDAVEFGSELKGNPDTQSVPILGFFSHVEVELQRRAMGAGFDRVLPRSVFARDLAAILRGS